MHACHLQLHIVFCLVRVALKLLRFLSPSEIRLARHQLQATWAGGLLEVCRVQLTRVVVLRLRAGRVLYRWQ